jgi:hypothetical protein
MAESPFAAQRGVPLGEPLAFQLADDGTGYVVAVDTERRRDRQSVMTAIDPSTGERAGPLSRSIQFFGRRIETFAALGSVRADRTPPRVRVGVPRRIRAATLLNRRLPVLARTNEAAQVTASLRVRGRAAGFAFETRDTPGLFQFEPFLLTRREIGRILRGIGGRVRVVVRVNDLKGNHRTVVRTARLTR